MLNASPKLFYLYHLIWKPLLKIDESITVNGVTDNNMPFEGKDKHDQVW
jgi:hypothetical protein